MSKRARVLATLFIIFSSRHPPRLTGLQLLRDPAAVMVHAPTVRQAEAFRHASHQEQSMVGIPQKLSVCVKNAWRRTAPAVLCQAAQATLQKAQQVTTSLARRKATVSSAHRAGASSLHRALCLPDLPRIGMPITSARLVQSSQVRTAPVRRTADRRTAIPRARRERKAAREATRADLASCGSHLFSHAHCATAKQRRTHYRGQQASAARRNVALRPQAR